MKKTLQKLKGSRRRDVSAQWICLSLSILLVTNCGVGIRWHHEYDGKVNVRVESAQENIRISTGSGRPLGTAPRTVKLLYSVERSRFQRGLWAWPVASALLAGVGIGLLASGLKWKGGNEGEIGAGAALVPLNFLSMIVGFGICGAGEVQHGRLRRIPESMMLVATPPVGDPYIFRVSMRSESKTIRVPAFPSMIDPQPE